MIYDLQYISTILCYIMLNSEFLLIFYIAVFLMFTVFCHAFMCLLPCTMYCIVVYSYIYLHRKPK